MNKNKSNPYGIKTPTSFFYKSSTYCKIYSNWKEIQSKMVNTMHHSIKKLVEEELSNFKPPNRNLTNRGSLELK
jgi:hypothetical protein